MITSVMPNLYSTDVQRAIAFYRDTLEGTETFRTPKEGQPEHVEIRFGDVTLAVTSSHALDEAGLPAATKGNPMELVVWCESTDETVATLRKADVPILVEPFDYISGYRRAYVTDPDGNRLALVSPTTTT
jgi:lactoylglutathione lyase